MLILSEKQYFEKWVEENDLGDDIALAVSDSNYSKVEIGLK